MREIELLSRSGILRSLEKKLTITTGSENSELTLTLS